MFGYINNNNQAFIVTQWVNLWVFFPKHKACGELLTDVFCTIIQTTGGYIFQNIYDKLKEMDPLNQPLKKMSVSVVKRK